LALKNKNKMNLHKQAESEKERRTRSKLEAHRDAILALRRKHWTHKAIAQWLNERGIQITLSAVHRFCQRAIARRPRATSDMPAAAEEQPAFIPTPQPQPNETMPVKKHRFNLDIY
jgi:transposase InsO family protein